MKWFKSSPYEEMFYFFFIMNIFTGIYTAIMFLYHFPLFGFIGCCLFTWVSGKTLYHGWLAKEDIKSQNRVDNK